MMNTPKEKGCLVVSIDLRATGRADAVASLMVPFQRNQVDATWAVEEPGQSVLVERIRERLPLSDFGVLGDVDWISPEAGRTRFARELSRRMGDAQRRQVPISTLALVGTTLDEHLDLLVKHRISWVREDGNSGSSRMAARPQSLRYGVWKAAPTLQLPAARRWPRAVSFFGLRQVLHRAVQEATLVHLRLDANRLAETPRQLAALEHLLQFAKQKRAEGELSVLTLGQLAHRMVPHRQQAPMRSILRRAA